MEISTEINKEVLGVVLQLLQHSFAITDELSKVEDDLSYEESSQTILNIILKIEQLIKAMEENPEAKIEEYLAVEDFSVIIYLFSMMKTFILQDFALKQAQVDLFSEYENKFSIALRDIYYKD